MIKTRKTLASSEYDCQGCYQARRFTKADINAAGNLFQINLCKHCAEFLAAGLVKTKFTGQTIAFDMTTRQKNELEKELKENEDE